MSIKVNQYTITKKNIILGLYPICPRCESTDNSGTIGVKAQNKVWACCDCADCGHKFRYEM